MSTKPPATVSGNTFSGIARKSIPPTISTISNGTLSSNMHGSFNNSHDAAMYINDDAIRITNKLVLDNGHSDVNSRLERLEKILNLHIRDEDLEALHPDLKAMGDIADQCIQDHLMSLSDSLKQLQKTYKRYQAECELMEKLKRE